MKKKRDYLKIISTAIAMVAFFLVLINVVTSNTGAHHLNSTEAVDISSGWKNIDTGEEETSKSVRVLPGATLKLSRTLPDHLNDDNVMGYYDYGFRVMAFVDDKEIYTAGWENYSKFGTQASQSWRAIPLSSEDSGKTLLIFFENDTDSTMRVNLSQMRITYESSEIVRAITTSKWALIIIALCLVIFVVLLIFSFAIWKQGFTDSFHRLLELAALSLTVAVWSWANCSIAQLLLPDEAMAYKLSYLSYFLIPMFMGLFYERISEDPNHIFYLSNTLYRFLLVVVYVLHLTGFVPLAQSVFIAHVFLFTELLIGNFYGIRNYMKSRTHTNHWAMIGQLVFLLVSLIYIPLYYLQGAEHVFLYAGVAFIIFAICMTTSQGYYLLKDLQKHRRQMEYREQSGINPLTGGYSLLGLAYYMEDFDFTGIDAPWFVVMEMTNFSAINALLGWQNGETIIKGIYETNKLALEEGDIQATAGESEFIFLLPAEKNIEDFSAEIRLGIQRYLAMNMQNIYLALRFTVARFNPGDNMNTLLSKAHLAFYGQDRQKDRTSYAYYFNADCHDRVLKSQVVVNEVSRALLNENMRLLITPEFDAKTGQICQGDTVLVWNEKAEGEMFDSQDIPTAEKDELGLRMNAQHVAKAMEYLAEYPLAEGVRISLHIFRDCLTNKMFWEGFEEAAEGYDVDFSHLDFELPLELASKAFPDLKEVAKRLKSKGATISCSKFDGNLSTLRAIKELQLDWVKFDESLLDKADENHPEIYEQLQYFIDLLHAQGQKVCICGISDSNDIEKIKALGPDRIKGNRLQTPVLEETFYELVQVKEG